MYADQSLCFAKILCALKIARFLPRRLSHPGYPFTLERQETAAGTSSPYLASRSKMTNLGTDPNGNASRNCCTGTVVRWHRTGFRLYWKLISKVRRPVGRQHNCSHHCRQQMRRQQHRMANRRHQQTPEGRQDHRDRQRAYRRRHSAPRVTDVSSPMLSRAGRMPLRCALPIRNLHAQGNDAPQRHHGLLRCVLCGRLGRFVEPFPRIFRR
jgi:hypothetical protein